MEWTWSVRTALRECIVPIFLLYSVSALFFQQALFAQNSQILLLIKLTLGVCALGVYPYWRMRRIHRAPALFPSRGAWDRMLILFSVFSGVFLLYTYLFLRFEVFSQLKYMPLFEYYGHFSSTSLGYIPLLALMVLYVTAEEIFFRGMIYRYLRTRAPLVFAVFCAVELFVYAHLNIEPPLVITLTLLSVITIVLYEKTQTLFYGCITHAVLDVGALIMLTDTFGVIIRNSVPVVFGVLTGVLVFILFSTVSQYRSQGSVIAKYMYFLAAAVICDVAVAVTVLS